MESFGRRVAKQRADLGWTQQALAGRLGISRVALSHIEAEMTWPNERTVTLLAGVFRLEPHELVAGTNYPAAKGDRLPPVTARYTEVEHQLELLATDLRWLDALAAAGLDPARVAVLEREVGGGWRARLGALLQTAFDLEERHRLGVALERLAHLGG